MLIDGASSNVVLGNFVGTNPGGAAALGNEFVGINLRNGATANTIGGRNASAFVASVGNVIAGNVDDGVRIEGTGTSGNLVVGNLIGTDAAGTAELGNDNTGIEINDASGNTVGGGDPRLGNVISGNARGRHAHLPAGASSNLVQGNRIGTNAAGTLAIANPRTASSSTGRLGQHRRRRRREARAT